MQGEGRAVGRYHLVERLAVGGMAEIFLACEKGAHGFERLVVIKKMLPSLAEDASFVAMFLQEARTQAQVNHPNVVHIHELGEAGGLPYMVMEYVPGSTLRQLLQAAIAANVELPVSVALDLLMQACAGAHAIHELRDPSGAELHLVHRDLTPHNLMVTDDGFLKVLDFGIVKARGDDEMRTRTGVLKGKIAYMSPEQCLQEDLDRRSDLFTLGNVGWELLSRDKLFKAANEVGVMQAIITGNVRDLRAERPDLPDPVVHALERALATARDSRYDTADAMRRAIQAAAEVSGIPISRDRTAAFVRALLGDRHASRKRAVEDALEKTLVTLSPMRPPDASSLTAVTSATRVGLAGVFGAMVLGLAGGAFVLAGLALIVAGLVNPEGLGLSSGDPVDDYIPPQGVSVTLLMAPTLEREVLLAEWEPLRRHLEVGLGRPLRLEVADSYGDASERLLRGEVAFAMLPPNILLKTLDADPSGVRALATKIYDGSSTFEGMLLVGGASSAGRIEQLAGGTICYSDRDSTTGYVFPRLWIREAGLDPDRDFTAHFSGNHTQVLRDLLAGVCDVGGTYTGNYAAASSADIPVAQLRILAITGRSPHDAIAAGPSASDADEQRLLKALLGFDPKVQLGRSRLGEREQITGFSRADEEAFGMLREAIRAETVSTRP